MLTVEGLAAGYGESVAVSDVDLHVDDGEAVAVGVEDVAALFAPGPMPDRVE